MNVWKILWIIAAVSPTACRSGQPSASVRQPEPSGVIQSEVFVTAAGTDLRITPTGALEFQADSQPLQHIPYVLVNPAVTFQTMHGFGGAITDAAAETFARLPEEKQQELLQAYYDPQSGIGYNFGRINMAGCDFSSSSYHHIEEGDTELKTFDLSPDEKHRIPLLRQIQETTQDELLLLVSPWSPPAWMKSNRNVLRGGSLLDPYKPAWANYYIRFIDEYEKRGIPIWGVSVQNEPMAAQSWESCIYTAEEERDFIKNYLGPTIARSAHKDLKLIAWDHNRDLIYHRAHTIMNDPEAARYVWGFGFHWYGQALFDNLKLVKESYPEKELLFTEGCAEGFHPEKITNWALGERYAYSMIRDLNSGTSAWLEWNILLDEKGGPNHAGNFCFAPVHADTRTGELIYTNSYYYIGHFSKFIRRGAKRIAVSSTRNNLETTGFLNPDGSVAVILLNRTDHPIAFKLGMNGRATDLTAFPHSILTVVFST
ncbi:MAG: glycosyl hydrolase [Culturomica sp.]|nr:glycosyl hydrolase [Culturomica sp.]